MFYSQFILAKKGSLGTIWIAAHLERKLRKSQVNETDISVSVDSILFPEVPIALRLSGHLLLGVVRIYARKVHYLYQDCSEALLKIKDAFHFGAVDLPPEAARAPFHAITLPETFDFEDAVMVPYQESFYSDLELHKTDRDQITLHEPLQDVFFFAPQVEADEQFQDEDVTNNEEEKDLLFTITQREQAIPMQTLEEDVLPPMAMDMELDENINEKLEVSFPSLMDQDEYHTMTLAPRLSDETTAQAGITSEQEQTNASYMDNCETLIPVMVVDLDISGNNNPGVEKLISAVEQPIDGTYLVTSLCEPSKISDMCIIPPGNEAVKPISKVDMDMLTDDVPEVEKLRSAKEPILAETDLPTPAHDFVIADKSLQPLGVDEDVFLMEDAVALVRNKEHGNQELHFNHSSPSPSPGIMVSSLRNIPEDDDILASILGVTPSIKVAATPIETLVPNSNVGKKRKRKPFFDAATLIPNEAMKRQTENVDDLLRVRKKASYSEFERWRAEKSCHPKATFPRASIYGLSSELLALYDHLPVTNNIDSPGADVPVSVSNSEPCTPQAGIDVTDMADPSFMHNADDEMCEVRSPSGDRNSLQPSMEPVCLPIGATDPHLDSNQEQRHGMNLEGTLATDLPLQVNLEETCESNLKEIIHEIPECASAASVGTEELQVVCHAKDMDVQLDDSVRFAETVIPSISGQTDQSTDTQTTEIQQSKEAVTLPFKESSELSLNFLADPTPENNELLDNIYVLEGSRLSKPNLKGQYHNGWSERTRAVAQFLQEAFKARESGTKRLGEECNSNLSLDKMLTKRNRKQAARMFFETMVLKTQDYIGVQQEDAYGPITLTPQPKLLKTIF